MQASIRPLTFFPVYCASKAELDALTKTMAVEFGKHKIRVVSINPAGIETSNTGRHLGMSTEQHVERVNKLLPGRFPLDEVLTPVEQVVNTILFLASGIAGVMTGNSVALDGGLLAT